MRFLLIISTILGPLSAFGQPCTKNIIIKSDTIFFTPEKAPSTEEGLELYMAWISNHMNQKLKSTDEQPKKKVYVSFIVDEHGRLSDFKIEKGVGTPYDKEAIRLLKNHPHRWTPGQCGTRNVKTRVTSFVWF